MLKLNLESLEIIDAIARKGSFAAAAEAVHRVPSAVTYMVRKLEDELGVQLFDRSGHRARLTPAGETLLEEGRHLLRAAGDLECRVRRVATGWETELNIALDALIPLSLLHPWIADFDALESATQLRFSRETLAGVWEALIDHRADLVIGASLDGPYGGGYATHCLGECEFVFAVAPQHPLAALPEPLRAAQIRQYRSCVVADSSRHLMPRTVGVLSGQETMSVPDLATKLDVQLAGLGCGYLLRSVAAPYLADGRLVERAVEEVAPPARLYAAWRTSGAGRALRWWLDALAADDRIGRWLAGR